MHWVLGHDLLNLVVSRTLHAYNAYVKFSFANAVSELSINIGLTLRANYSVTCGLHGCAQQLVSPPYGVVHVNLWGKYLLASSASSIIFFMTSSMCNITRRTGIDCTAVQTQPFNFKCAKLAACSPCILFSFFVGSFAAMAHRLAYPTMFANIVQC